MCLSRLHYDNCVIMCPIFPQSIVKTNMIKYKTFSSGCGSHQSSHWHCSLWSPLLQSRLASHWPCLLHWHCPLEEASCRQQGKKNKILFEKYLSDICRFKRQTSVISMTRLCSRDLLKLNKHSGHDTVSRNHGELNSTRISRYSRHSLLIKL